MAHVRAKPAATAETLPLFWKPPTTDLTLRAVFTGTEVVPMPNCPALLLPQQ